LRLGGRCGKLARALVSGPVLAAGLVSVTVLATGPLAPVDRALDRPWDEWLWPRWGPFWAEVVDPLARQAVVVPLLGLVAVVLAWRRWSFRPLVTACAAEFGAVVVGGVMKVGFARPSPKLADPAFLHGGLLADGWRGISYPSGHALEAILLYGSIVFLIARYSSASPKTVRALAAVTALITMVTVCQSFYMQWHWVSDLAGGLLVGALALRLVTALDKTLWPRLPLDLPAAEPVGVFSGLLRPRRGVAGPFGRSRARPGSRDTHPPRLGPSPGAVFAPSPPRQDRGLGGWED
jgi:undecaprenyl-diphosphatase